jgi:hypothetical protein
MYLIQIFINTRRSLLFRVLPWIPGLVVRLLAKVIINSVGTTIGNPGITIGNSKIIIGNPGVMAGE